MQNTPLPSVVPEEEIVRLRQQIRPILEKAVADAALSGKPPLILVGENHVSHDSALLEIIIFDEAKRLGFQHLAIEMPEEARTEFDNVQMRRSLVAGTDVSYELASFAGDTIHFVDSQAMSVVTSLQESSAQNYGSVLLGSVDSRNQEMATRLASIAAPTLMITGDLHLEGLRNETDLGDHFTLVAFSTTDKFLPTNYSLTGEVVNVPRTGIEQLNLGFKAVDLGPERLIRLGMQSSAAADRFLQFLQRAHQIVTPEETAANLLTNEAAWRANPNDAKNIFNYGQSLLDANRDREAGNVFAPLRDICVSNESGSVAMVCSAAAAMERTALFEEGMFQSLRALDISKIHDISELPSRLPVPSTPSAAATTPVRDPSKPQPSGGRVL